LHRDQIPHRLSHRQVDRWWFKVGVTLGTSDNAAGEDLIVFRQDDKGEVIANVLGNICDRFRCARPIFRAALRLVSFLF